MGFNSRFDSRGGIWCVRCGGGAGGVGCDEEDDGRMRKEKEDKEEQTELVWED